MKHRNTEKESSQTFHFGTTGGVSLLKYFKKKQHPPPKKYRQSAQTVGSVWNCAETFTKVAAWRPEWSCSLKWTDFFTLWLSDFTWAFNGNNNNNATHLSNGQHQKNPGQQFPLANQAFKLHNGTCSSWLFFPRFNGNIQTLNVELIADSKKKRHRLFLGTKSMVVSGSPNR